MCADVGFNLFFSVCLLFQPLADDLRLNSLVFQWPEQILIELENSKLRLAAMREKSEDCLTTRSLNDHFSLADASKSRSHI